jgi:hypothetical protein
VHSNGNVLDDEILADKDVREAIRTQGSTTKSYDIVNVDRSALGRLAGAVAKPYGDSGGSVCACLERHRVKASTYTPTRSGWSGMGLQGGSGCLGGWRALWQSLMATQVGPSVHV